jgi:hypothetical protein
MTLLIILLILFFIWQKNSQFVYSEGDIAMHLSALIFDKFISLDVSRQAGNAISRSIINVIYIKFQEVTKLLTMINLC